MVRRGKIVFGLCGVGRGGVGLCRCSACAPDLVGHIEAGRRLDLSCGELARAMGLPSAHDVDALSVAFVPPAVVESRPVDQGHAVVVLMSATTA